jgi:parvulin-like peptidyl-prolyl isomerase
MRNLLTLGLSLGVAALAATSATGADSNSAARATTDSRLAALFGDPVVAKAKTFEVKQSQLDAEVARSKAAMAASGRTMPANMDAQVLDGMIALKLLLAQATDAERKQGKEEFDKSFADYKKVRNLTDEQFDERLIPDLRAQGKSKAEWETEQINQAIVPLVLKRDLKSTVTEEAAKKYYEDNPGKFESPEMVRVSHILLSTKDPNDKAQDPAQRKDLPEDQKQAKKKLAEDLLKRARGGEDFTKLAKEYSDDPGVKQNNGEYTFSREDPFVPEFKTAAFALKTNEVSDIIPTIFGYHIIKLWEKLPARKEAYKGTETKTIYKKPDAAARKGDDQYVTIKDILSDQMMREQLPDYIKKLKKDAGVQIMDERLKLPVQDTLPASVPTSNPGKK